MAPVRVPREFAERPSRRHHICVRDPSVHCYFLSGNPARVQTLQGLQRHAAEQDANRGGRGARHQGPVLPHRDSVHRLVLVRANGPVPSLSEQVQLFQRRHEHHRPHRHHSVLHHTRHCRGRGGEGAPQHVRRDGPPRGQGDAARWRPGREPGHVPGHSPSYTARPCLSNIQVVQTLQGFTDLGADVESFHARIRVAHIFPFHR